MPKDNFGTLCIKGLNVVLALHEKLRMENINGKLENIKDFFSKFLLKYKPHQRL